MSSIVIARWTSSFHRRARPAPSPAADRPPPTVQEPRIFSTKRRPCGGASGPVGSNGTSLRGEVRARVADAHVDDTAHVARGEEQQVVERHRRRVADDVDADLAVLRVRAGADRRVDRLDLASSS